MLRKCNYVLVAAWAFIGIAVLAGVGLMLVGLAGCQTFDGFRSTLLSQMKGSLGDVLAGTLGVCLSFSATLFMIVTFKEQRKQFQEQFRQSNRERFENTFFNMLSRFQDVRANVEKYLLYRHNVQSIESYYAEFKSYYDSRRTTMPVVMIEKILSDSDMTEVELERAEEGLGKLYCDYAAGYGGSIGYFFRYIHNMIKFVIDQWGQSDGGVVDVKRYLNLIQAQMSDEELGLIFYDAISAHGLSRDYDKIFKENLDRYGFLENISSEALLNRNDYKIYRLTTFRFLNAEEKNRKIAHAGK